MRVNHKTPTTAIFRKIAAGVVILLLVFVAMSRLSGRLPVQAAETTYSIRVNVAANVVTIYKNGKPFKVMLCSTGPATPTSGTYGLKEKHRWHTLFYGVYGQYTSCITGNILFHSIPYERYKDPGSLQYWCYDHLGTADSHGCVRLACADAKWIYDNCPQGTKVTMYSNAAVPGPMGKPGLSPISASPDKLRSWDPTDPDAQNPWHAYTGTAFDAEYYYAHYPDLQEAVGHDAERLRLHWLTSGIREGRQASARFWMLEYENKNGLPGGEMNHYASVLQFNREVNESGKTLSSLTRETFDHVYYANLYPDVKAAFGYDAAKLWAHYVHFGVAEGRQARAKK